MLNNFNSQFGVPESTHVGTLNCWGNLVRGLKRKGNDACAKEISSDVQKVMNDCAECVCKLTTGTKPDRDQLKYEKYVAVRIKQALCSAVKDKKCTSKGK